MREIKFRGKRLDNRELVYGYYLVDEQHGNPRHCVWCRESTGDFIANDMIVVDPATFGQYIGLNDTDGNEIYEGDIVEISLVSPFSHMPIVTGRSEVTFKDGIFGVEWGNKNEFTPLSRFSPKTIIKVIGNIHDNPDLLKKEASS